VWFGLFAPAGLPEPIGAKLRAAVSDMMRRPDFQARMEKIGFEVMPIRTPAQSAEFVRAEIAKWVPIVELSGAKAE
jgi:tripartite-type tricarboxylate transporter receptor subunit TctC